MNKNIYATIICPHCGYELPCDEVMYQYNYRHKDKKCNGTCYMCGKEFRLW